MTLNERATVFEQLGRMLKAGMSYHAALDTLSQHHFSSRARKFVDSLRAGVSESMGLTEALRGPAAGSTLPMEVSIIEAGERSGKIDEACAFVARHYHVAAKTLARIKAGFIMPVMTLHVALAVFVIVRHAAEPMTDLLGRIFVVWLWMWAGLAALWFGAQWLLRKAADNPRLDAFLHRIPLLGSMRAQFAISRFARVCNVGMLAGLRMSETLRLAAEATQSPRLKAAGEATAVRVEDGFSLAESLKKTGAFPTEFITPVAVAENTGDLDGTMDRYSVESAEAAGRSIDRLSVVVPKVFYAIVAAVAVWIIFKFYMGRFQQFQDLMPN